MKNMFRFLILMLSVVMFSTGFAQSNKRIDSLLLMLQEVNSDTSKILTYHDLHKEYVRLDSVQAIRYLDLAFKLSEKTKSKMHLCQTYLLLCNFRWKKGNLNTAKKALAAAENLLKHIKNDKLEATYFIEHGLVAYYDGSYAIAVENFLLGVEKYKVLKDNTGESKCYSNIGICYMELENMDKALEYYLKAEKVLVAPEDNKTLSGIWGNIGIIYKNKEAYGKALEYYKKSLQVNQKLGMKWDEAINLQNIGALYEKSGEFSKSLNYFKDAKKLCEQINDKIGILYADHGTASTLIQLGKFSEGITLLNTSLLFAEELEVNHELRD
ncbi:tetratricopeptide repeat protein, partial [Maribacter sp.]|nr:tetratricopeptide repeat protein [Maribacter sp.]